MLSAPEQDCEGDNGLIFATVWCIRGNMLKQLQSGEPFSSIVLQPKTGCARPVIRQTYQRPRLCHAQGAFFGSAENAPRNWQLESAHSATAWVRFVRGISEFNIIFRRIEYFFTWIEKNRMAKYTNMKWGVRVHTRGLVTPLKKCVQYRQYCLIICPFWKSFFAGISDLFFASIPPQSAA